MKTSDKNIAIEFHMNRNGVSREQAESDWDHDYLSINSGRDGKEYVWYVDGSSNEYAAELITGIVLSESEVDAILA